MHISHTEKINQFSFRFSGKLLLRNEIPVDDKTFHNMVASHFFTPVPSITKKLFQPFCVRCGNRQPSMFGKIPCQLCHKTHLYCRKCIEMGRVMECQSLYGWSGPEPLWPLHSNPCSWNGHLTAGQQRAADRIVSAIEHQEAKILCWAVCGAGKTEMLFPAITRALQLGNRICLATPRADVVRELLPRIRQAFSAVTIQGLYGSSMEKDGTAQIIIATTHQLLRFNKAFDVLIIDELDAFPYHADPSLPYAADRAKKKNSTTVYLTATPRKKQRMQITSKKLPHIFVPIRFHGHPLPVPILKMCPYLKKNLASFNPPNALLQWMTKRNNPNRQLLVFVPTVNLAKHMTSKLMKLMLEAGLLLSEADIVSVHASNPNREEIIQQFRKKDIHVLVTTTILERGVTFPSVDVAVIDAGHVVFDEAALVQISGRAGRSPDDPTGEVVFFHDGKTDAMVQAIRSIIKMNKRGGFC